MSSALSNLTCEICFDFYDIEIRIPKSLSCCGKTVCRKCLEVVLRNHSLQCPWCKSKINADSKTYKTNLQLLSIVQEDSKWEKCPHHDENMKLVCLNPFTAACPIDGTHHMTRERIKDKRKVCPYCGYTSECKNHDLVHLLELKPASDERLGELEDHLSRTDKKMEKYDQMISQNRVMFQDMICDSFDKQIYELQKAKAKTLMKVNSVLSKRQVEANKTFGQNSSLRAEVQNKIYNHMNFFKVENPFRLIEEDLTMLKSRVESLVGGGQDVVDFEQQLSRMAPLVQRRLNNMLSVPKQEDLIEMIDQGIKEVPGVERESEDIEELSLQISGLSVNFWKMENEKTVLSFRFERDRAIKSVKLDYKKVKETEGVSIDLQSIEWNECNLKALEYALALQARTSEVYIVLRANLVVQKPEKLARLFSVLFRKPRDIKELVAYLPADDNIVMLLNALIPQFSSLKKLRINSIAFGISRQCLNDFAENLVLLAPSLEDFHLSISGSNFAVKNFSFSMPKVQKFNLNVRNIAEFDDRLLIEIVENLPVSMPNVQNFNIDVCQTHVTHACVKVLLEKTIHIPTFSLTYDNPPEQPHEAHRFLDRNFQQMVAMRQNAQGTGEIPVDLPSNSGRRNVQSFILGDYY